MIAVNGRSVCIVGGPDRDDYARRADISQRDDDPVDFDTTGPRG